MVNELIKLKINVKFERVQTELYRKPNFIKTYVKIHKYNTLKCLYIKILNLFIYFILHI